MRGYNIDDYIEKQFNKLTLIKNLKKLDKHNSKLALFKCDCGKEKQISFTQVLNSKVKSCGCAKRDKLSNLSNKNVRENRILYNLEHIQKNNSSGYNGISIINSKYRVRISYNKKIYISAILIL